MVFIKPNKPSLPDMCPVKNREHTYNHNKMSIINQLTSMSMSTCVMKLKKLQKIKEIISTNSSSSLKPQLSKATIILCRTFTAGGLTFKNVLRNTSFKVVEWVRGFKEISYLWWKYWYELMYQFTLSLLPTLFLVHISMMFTSSDNKFNLVQF